MGASMISAESSDHGSLCESSARRYQLLARLDRGGMADVYLALARGPLDFKKLLVVKCLRVVGGHEELCRRMFIDEAHLAARLNHPNVVQTYEIGETDGRPLIAMEYLEGQSLARLRKAAKLIDARRAARIMSDALAGLHYAHELRDYDGVPLSIVHRDLSPQNIFVTYEGTVKILDFGVARAALPSRSRTKVGVLKGKFSYMAPEQTSGEAIDQRTDVFTAGIVLWELVAGRRMFGGTAVQKLKALIHDPIPRLGSVREGIDPELERIVHKALEKDSALRYQSAEAMREELERFLAQSGPPVRNEDIGRLMLSHFAVERSELRREIQELMAAESLSVPASVPASVPRLKAAEVREASASVPPSPDSLSPLTRPEAVKLGAATQEVARSFARDRRRKLYVGLGLVSLLLGAGVTLVVASESTRAKPVYAAPPLAARAAAPAAKAELTSAPARTAEPAPPAPSPAEAEADVTVSEVSSNPEVSAPPPRVRRVAAPRAAIPRMPLPLQREAVPAEPTASAVPPQPAAASPPRVRLVNDKPRMPLVE